MLAQAQTNLIDTATGNTPLHILAAIDERSLYNSHQDDKCCGLISSGKKKNLKQVTDEGSVTESASSEALLDLLLPFATESKSVINNEGFMPW